MSKIPNQKKSVIPLFKKKDLNKSAEKWGKPVLDYGFCIFPSLLLKAQNRIGLNPTQLAILLQIIDYWWEANRMPFPSKKSLSDRLGLGERQIQRHIAEMEKAGLIRRIERTTKHKGKTSNGYDLSGLVRKLKELEPEFTKAKNANKAVIKRGGLDINL